MRLIVELGGPKELRLPANYNELLQGVIYQVIADPALRSVLHEIGFPIGQRKFKLFCFSRLLGSCHFDAATGEFVFGSKVTLIISSPVNLLIQEIGSTLLRQGWVRIGGNRLVVKNIRVKELQKPRDKFVARMLSPICVYSTTIENDRKRTHYYGPQDLRFAELLHANLEKKHLLVKGVASFSPVFSITPLAVRDRDCKMLKFKGTWVRGWMGKYLLEGDPELLRVAYDAGLGSKNSQGFGLFEVEEAM